MEIYEDNLDKNGKSTFDLILTDINMPPHNGDKAAIDIRKIERLNNIKHHELTPIIALTGNGTRKDIFYFFKCQVNDYFIKGNSTQMLVDLGSVNFYN